MSASVGASVPVLAAVLLTATACHTRPPAMSPAPVASTAAPVVPKSPPPPLPPPAATTRATSTSMTDRERFDRESLEQLNADRPLADVFFDYDQDELRDDGRRALQDDARWLTKWPSTVIRIDGHCDERGTGEYNLALGERRAATLREYLVNLGVNPSRVDVRSLGKEAPFCHGEGDSCWAQNRRGHFVITRK